MVKPLPLVLVGALILVGCPAETGPPGATVREGREQGVEAGTRASHVYAAVIRRLVTKDHTFGSSRSPFKHLFVVDGAVHGDLMEGNGDPAKPFSADMKEHPLSGRAGKVEVSASLWCGGLCGLWLTFVVELRGNRWVVAGTTGPAAIS